MANMISKLAILPMAFLTRERYFLGGRIAAAKENANA
jgi:hypothetical protein